MSDTLTNAGLFERGQAVIPGGVSSPVRSFSSVGGSPYFVARAQGAHVWDVEGRRYTDYVQSYGAVVVGHAHPKVTEAVTAAAAAGTSYGAPTEGEVLLAEAICERVPSVDKVRLLNSGTEAAMTALRVARGFTGRDVVVKFAGCYHGHSDGLLAEAGSGLAQHGLPASAGVPDAVVSCTRVEPFNVVPTLDDTVAAVIVEPVPANMGLVPPVPGFLAGLRAECDRVGALLVFDEVISGFRFGPAGAQGLAGVTPDLTCFGKVIGGGFPLAAVGGRAEVMDVLAPLGGVYQAGTLSGNPVATAAGLAVLELLDDGAHHQLHGRAAMFGEWLRKELVEAGLPAQVVVEGPLLGVFFADEAPKDYDEARATHTELYNAWFHELLDRGIAFAPGAFEVVFPGLAHTKDELERTTDLAAAAARAVAERTGWA